MTIYMIGAGIGATLGAYQGASKAHLNGLYTSLPYVLSQNEQEAKVAFIKGKVTSVCAYSAFGGIIGLISAVIAKVIFSIGSSIAAGTASPALIGLVAIPLAIGTAIYLGFSNPRRIDQLTDQRIDHM